MFDRPFFWALDDSVEGFELGSVPWFYYPYNLRLTK
jgi:hypothetical protein